MEKFSIVIRDFHCGNIVKPLWDATPFPERSQLAAWFWRWRLDPRPQYLNYQHKSVPNMAGTHTGNYRLTVVIVAVAYFICHLHVKS